MTDPGPASVEVSLLRKIGRRGWVSILGLLFGIAALNSSIYITTELAERGSAQVAEHIVAEFLAIFTVAPLIPILLWVIERYRIRANNWHRFVPLHVLASMAIGGSHTLLMWGSRSLVWPWLGWGAYNYGDLRYRFPMEYSKQAIWYTITYVGVTWMIERGRRQRAREHYETLQRQLTEARLESLRAQLNPHFLFNTLNMIGNYVHESPAVAESMITRLSQFLRMNLDASGEALVTLERELEFLTAYVDIMCVRFEDALEVRVDVDPSVQKALVPQLTLQPLLENAITHGMKPATHELRIEVLAERRSAELVIVVRDNGRGLTDGALEEGRGLGHTRARLVEVFGADASVTLHDRKDGGCEVTLRMPWREAEGAP